MPHSSIVAVTGDEQYGDFAALIRDYVEWCRERYAAERWFIDAAFGYQSLEHELLALPSSYGPPKGRAFLARSGDLAVGCIAYRALSETVCEMKRLFIRPEGQGQGTGRALCMALVDAARNDGYALMRLDTASMFSEAIALYRSIGFRDCPAYNHYPDAIARHVVFMEMPLAPAQDAGAVTPPAAG